MWPSVTNRTYIQNTNKKTHKNIHMTYIKFIYLFIPRFDRHNLYACVKKSQGHLCAQLTSCDIAV